MTTTTTRAVLYARVSGDDRKYATSGIGGQLADCRQYAQARGYQVVGEYFEEPDTNTSGAVMLPEIENVLKLARGGAFDALIVREIDRLARNRFKQLSVENDLKRHGVRVEYVVGQYADTAEGRLSKGLAAEFAEYEREKIRQRTQRGRIKSIEAGNVAIGGSYAPYGYDLAKVNGRRQLVVNGAEAAVIRLIFDLYVNNLYTLHGICNHLDAQAIPKPAKGANHRQVTDNERAHGWSVGTLGGILTNETYVGRWYYRKTKTIKNPKTGKPQNVPRPRDEWIMVNVPAILGERIFNAAQRRREANKRRQGNGRRHTYALGGGLLTCGLCGNNMSGMTKYDRGRPYQYYKCNARHMPKRYGFRCGNPQYKVADVDALVWGFVKRVLLSPDGLRQALADYNEQQRAALQPVVGMIESNRARLDKAKAARARLVDAYAAGVLALDDIATQKQDIDRQIGDLTQALAQLQGELNGRVLTAEHVETIETFAARVRVGADLADDDPELQQQIFQLIEMDATLTADDDGRRWVDLACVLGAARYAVDDTNG